MRLGEWFRVPTSSTRTIWNGKNRCGPNAVAVAFPELTIVSEVMPSTWITWGSNTYVVEKSPVTQFTILNSENGNVALSR